MLNIAFPHIEKLCQKMIMTVALTFISIAHSNAADRGLNIPPTQGSTNAGAFLPGVYSYAYSNTNVYNIRNKGFTHIRVPINVDTANDSASLQKIKNFFAQTDYRGIICMFDTKRSGEGSHGDGRPNDLYATAQAWKNIHEVFKSYTNIKYEIFNEPFYYTNAQNYVDEMRYIIDVAGLPYSRSILDGMGYAGDLDSIKNLWSGDLAYHMYPNWLSGSDRTQSQYSNLLQTTLRDISHRVHITEFGANLSLGNVYNSFTNATDNNAANVNLLRGIHDALLTQAQQGSPIKATYHWHGWNNGDSYDVWDTKNRFGAAKIVAIQNGSNGQGGSGRGVTPPNNFTRLQALHSGRCLNVASNSTANGGNIVQWACGNYSNEDFEFVSRGSGWYNIKGRVSGKCLDVAGISKANGASIQQWRCGNGHNQQFALDDQGGGRFLLRARHSNKCINISRSSQANGANAVQWNCGNYNNSKFSFN